MIIYNDELYHYGKVGMKWGHRRATYGKIPRMLTTKRQLTADKKTLDKMNNGDHHVSVGFTKKRQEAYDKRDKAILEKRIDRNTDKMKRKEEHARITKAAVQKYRKQFDKASNMSDAADVEWKKAHELRMETGKSKISRVVNNIKYNPIKLK